MKTALVWFPLALCAGSLWPIHSWLDPLPEASLVIVCSLSAASVFFAWRILGMLRAQRLSAFRYALSIVCLLAIPWGILWSIGEELVIHRYAKHFGQGDMPGMERYIYPGNSGAGFADGVTAPLITLRNFAVLGAAVASLSLIPRWLTFRQDERA